MIWIFSDFKYISSKYSGSKRFDAGLKYWKFDVSLKSWKFNSVLILSIERTAV